MARRVTSGELTLGAVLKFPRDLGHSFLCCEGVSLSGLVWGQVAPCGVFA